MGGRGHERWPALPRCILGNADENTWSHTGGRDKDCIQPNFHQETLEEAGSRHARICHIDVLEHSDVGPHRSWC